MDVAFERLADLLTVEQIGLLRLLTEVDDSTLEIIVAHLPYNLELVLSAHHAVCDGQLTVFGRAFIDWL